jgi:hypothetical protein
VNDEYFVLGADIPSLNEPLTTDKIIEALAQIPPLPTFWMRHAEVSRVIPELQSIGQDMDGSRGLPFERVLIRDYRRGGIFYGAGVAQVYLDRDAPDGITQVEGEIRTRLEREWRTVERELICGLL